MRQGCLVLAVGRVRATLKKIEIPPHKKQNAHSISKSTKNRNTATAGNSKRPKLKEVPRVSPGSPVSADAGFVEIGHVHLSQSKI